MSRDNEVSVNIRADLRKLRRDLAEAKREVKKIPEQLDIRTNLIATGLKSKLNEIKQALKPLENIQMKVDTSALDVASRKAQKAARDINAALGASTKAARGGSGIPGVGGGRPVVTSGGSLAGMGGIDRAVVGGAALGIMGSRSVVTKGAVPNLGGAHAPHQASATGRGVIAAAMEQKARAAARRTEELQDLDQRTYRRTVAQRRKEAERQVKVDNKRAALDRAALANEYEMVRIRSKRLGRTTTTALHSGANTKANQTLATMRLRRSVPSGWAGPSARSQRLLAARAMMENAVGGGPGFWGRIGGGMGGGGSVGGFVGGGGGGRRPWRFMGGGGGGGTGRAGFGGAANFASGAIARGLYRSGAAGAIVGGAGALAVPAGVGAVAGKVFSDGIKRQASIEQTETSLRVLLKDGGAAKELVSELRKMEAETPVELTTLATNSQKLAASGFEAEAIPELLGTIMNAASVGVDTFENNAFRLTKALSQIKTNGRLLGEELLQLTDIGLPINEIIKEAFDMNSQELAKASQEGKVEIDVILDAITSGLKDKFGGALEEQTETLTGQLNMLKKAYRTVAEELADPAFDALSDFVSNLNEQIKSGEGGWVTFVEGLKNGMYLTEQLGKQLNQLRMGGPPGTSAVWEAGSTVTNPAAMMSWLAESDAGKRALDAMPQQARAYLDPLIASGKFASDPLGTLTDPEVTKAQRAANYERNRKQREEELQRNIGKVNAGWEGPSSDANEDRAIDARNFVRTSRIRKLQAEATIAEQKAQLKRDGVLADDMTPEQIAASKKNQAELEASKKQLSVAQLSVPTGNPIKDLINEAKVGEIQGGNSKGYQDAGKAFAKEYMAASGLRTKRVGEGQTSSDADAALDTIRTQFDNFELSDSAKTEFLRSVGAATGRSLETVQRDISGSDADRRMAAQRLESSMVGPTATASQIKKANQDTAIRERGEKFRRDFGAMDKAGKFDKAFRQGLLNRGISADDIDKFMEDNDVTAKGKVDGRLDKGGVLQFGTKAKAKADLGNAERTGFGDLQSLIQSKLDQSYERETAANTARVAKAVEEMNDKLNEPKGDKEITATVGP